jgi:hypothetical protein
VRQLSIKWKIVGLILISNFDFVKNIKFFVPFAQLGTYSNDQSHNLKIVEDIFSENIAESLWKTCGFCMEFESETKDTCTTCEELFWGKRDPLNDDVPACIKNLKSENSDDKEWADDCKKMQRTKMFVPYVFFF